MSKIHAPNIINYAFKLKEQEKAAFQDFVMPKNTIVDEGDKKRSKIAKYSLLGAIGIALVGIILSPKFLPKSFTNKIKDTTQKLTQQIEPIKSKANVLSNINSVKDSVVKKICDFIPPLRWLSDWSTGKYKQIGEKMTAKKFEKAFQSYEKILGKDSAQLKHITKTFGSEAQKAFSTKLDESFNGLDKQFGKKIWGQIKEKKWEELFKFTLQDMVEGDKARLSKEVLEKIDDIKLKDGELGLNPRLLKKAHKKLDKAAYTMYNDLFDKRRDISIGAAPSDILGIASSALGLGIYTAQADNKDERVSVALTTGIPFGLGIMGSMLATMRMISGFGAIAVGAATTIVSGIVGKSLDKAYKKKHGIEDKKPKIPTLELPQNLELPKIK